MFVGITNTPRDYAWGSDSAISTLLGTEPTGGAEAELWLGSHPGSPARVLDPASVGGAADLAEWIAASPAEALGAHPRLPFLLKVLAARSPLSLQAHPSAAQAQQGFLRENELGIRLDAPQRNYKDPYPKPEIIYALSERFEALCGFRPLDETVPLLGSLGLDSLAQRLEASSLAEVFEWLITRGDGVAALVDQVVALAGDSVSAIDGTVALDTVRMLAAEYPADPGIVVSLLLNRVTLSRGEALYLPAGNIHAYLSGLGVELMTASDNVLRGGLTPKHIDVQELLTVLDFTPTPVPYLAAQPGNGAATVFRPDGPGFELVHIRGAAKHSITGPAIALCTEGEVSIDGATASVRLVRGDAVYITPDEAGLTFGGAGEVFLATAT